MKEKAIQFGPGRNLTGIITDPTSTRPDGLPGVLFLNSGILHRVGACRLHVQIARALADVGFASLRFDFSGIGDSEPRKDSLSFEDSAPLEIVDAMDYMARARQTRTFILVGLCSGADAAFHAAVRDARVVGLCQLDPWAYGTWKHYFRHYGSKVRTAATWRRFIGRRLGLYPRSVAELPGKDLDLPTYVRETPPKDVVAGHLRALFDRGVRLLHVYSGGQAGYNYRDQVLDAFRSVKPREWLDVEYLPEASHIFTRLDHQRRVVQLIREWAQATVNASGVDVDDSASRSAAKQSDAVA